jgi:hypothetical protein
MTTATTCPSAGNVVPWVAITPVVRAIRILERIAPAGALLFATAHHDFGTGKHDG